MKCHIHSQKKFFTSSITSFNERRIIKRRHVCTQSLIDAIIVSTTLTMIKLFLVCAFISGSWANPIYDALDKDIKAWAQKPDTDKVQFAMSVPFESKNTHGHINLDKVTLTGIKR